MTVLMLAFWALVVGGVVALFRNRRPAGPDSGTTPGRSAENVLDERFARGEIDEQEYHARRAVLHSTQRR
ncbi:SHOCT domain-containing protein [Humibacillus sp. DSM 29435]|uniref:SHOCT domain-containing protein n=1 Tax=Humibacillus sp. DSM 29435 TaxID=1869167 RepID=UPI0020C7DC42|nr:SHOCT domain-containing protein [Humibacillus sp. DSM 29435]